MQEPEITIWYYCMIPVQKLDTTEVTISYEKVSSRILCEAVLSPDPQGFYEAESRRRWFL